MPRLPANLTGIPEEPIQDFTKPPVIEGVARKPSNEIVIPLEELEKKTSQDSKCRIRVVPRVFENRLEYFFLLAHLSYPMGNPLGQW